MHLLACSDLHGFHDTYRWVSEIAKKRKVDLALLAGDLLGVPDGFETVEDAQRSNGQQILGILEEMPIPVFYIMGNDDLVELEPKNDRVKSLHNRRIDIGEYNFVGYQYTLPFMGGIFEKPEDEIKKDLLKLAPLVDNRTILVTHSPALGFLDKSFLDENVGSESIRNFIERKNCLAHIHGHIHGQFGRDGNHFNVAAGRKCQAMIINLERMAHEELSGSNEVSQGK